MKHKAVNIVGAGPAGLTAAITLAKFSYKPVVYELVLYQKNCKYLVKKSLDNE